MTPERGHAHRKAKARALNLMRNGDPCCRCRAPMYKTQRLDYDHNDQDPTRYNGLAHAHCNRSAGATKGNRARTKTPTLPWHSRHW